MSEEREQPKCGAMLISMARWSQDDWLMLDTLFLSDEVFNAAFDNAKAVKGFRMEASACPAPMSGPMKPELSLLDKEDTPQLCAMIVEIAKLRKLFACAVIEISADDGVRSYRFLIKFKCGPSGFSHFTQVHCALLPVAAYTDDLGIGAVETKADFEEASAAESKWVWTYKWGAICACRKLCLNTCRL
eukprot:921085-Amphidinium_carterae.1